MVLDSVKCEICSKNLDFMTLVQREKHYNKHFQELDDPDLEIIEALGQPSSSKLPANQPSSSTQQNNKKRKWKPEKPAILGGESKKDVYWYPSMNPAEPIPENYTPGLIPFLRRCLLKSHGKGQTIRAVLCFKNTVHVCRQIWDAGWGCGYRNFIMACIALTEQTIQPMYGPLLNEGLPPGIRNLQLLLEAAWAAGYDPEGADELNHKLVGTNKWIGTSDLFTVFASRGIPSELVDFKNGGRGAKPLVDWIRNYFKPTDTSSPGNFLNGSPVLYTDRMPLILQRKGHSTTVVGYEILKDQSVNLLVFEPARNFDNRVRSAAIALSGLTSPAPGPAPLGPSSSNVIHIDDDIQIIEEHLNSPPAKRERKTFDVKPDDLRLFRMSLQSLEKHAEYQILHFPLRQPLTDVEREQRKRVDISTRI